MIRKVREAGNEMKSFEAPGLDGFPVECLMKGGMAVLEWLVRLLNISFDTGVVLSAAKVERHLKFSLNN